jgi:GNAT superfamily N-acetyltransferase
VPDEEKVPPEVRLLKPDDDVDGFVSGVEMIDHYLARFAWPMHQAGGPRTYVAVIDQRVIGYYSVASSSIEREDAPERLKAGMGAYPIPVQLLARMGVHQEYQGHGLGRDLLLAALLTTARASELVGVRAVVTHPITRSLTTFYGRYGFKVFNDPNYDLAMYTLMKDVRRTLRDGGLM